MAQKDEQLKLDDAEARTRKADLKLEAPPELVGRNERKQTEIERDSVTKEIKLRRSKLAQMKTSAEEKLQLLEAKLTSARTRVSSIEQSIARLTVPAPRDDPAARGGRVLTGTVVKRESLGSDVLAFMDLSPAKATGKESLALFDERPDDSAVTRPAGWIVARLPADSSVTEAQPLGVTVAANSLHLFDPVTGAAWARIRPGAAEPELHSSARQGQGSDRAG